MNEPHDLPNVSENLYQFLILLNYFQITLWAETVQAAVTAIRQAGSVIQLPSPSLLLIFYTVPQPNTSFSPVTTTLPLRLSCPADLLLLSRQ